MTGCPGSMVRRGGAAVPRPQVRARDGELRRGTAAGPVEGPAAVVLLTP